MKAGTRLAVNTSPEPASNIAVSTLEDVVVLAVVWFAIEHPLLAAGVAATFLVLGLLWAVRLVRRGWRRFRARRNRVAATGPPH